MALTRVTITGADDRTSISEMVRLSGLFPFVEWGILIGTGYGPRFPSLDWIRRLSEARLIDGNQMQFSLHLCGFPLRAMAAGLIAPVEEKIGGMLPIFARMQLNWHGERQSKAAVERLGISLDAISRNRLWSPEVICQLDGANDDIPQKLMPDFAASGLYDVSHGAGITPAHWPAVRHDIPCGYAGGLGPHNVTDELERINEAADGHDYWIDMESLVRTDGWLDLEKVKDVLCRAKTFMTRLEISQPA